MTPEEQAKAAYAEEIFQAHQTARIEPHHIAVSTGMRITMYMLGILDDEENSQIVQKATKKAEKFRAART